MYNIKPNILDYGLTQFTQAMPKEYKDSDYIRAYQKYYLGAKSHLMKYTNREMPEFVMKGLN